MLQAAQKRRVRLMILGGYVWNDPRQVLAEFQDSGCEGLLMLHRLPQDEAIPDPPGRSGAAGPRQ